MKKILSLVALLVSTFVRAEMNDSLIVFSTPGPDKYSDGTLVLSGESYALVWQKNGTTFLGFTDDCRAVDDLNTKILAVAPLAKEGKCPETLFEIDADFAAELNDGSFALYLLDTRVTNTILSQYDNGRPKVINAIGTNGGEAINLASVGMASKIEDPIIVGMAIENAKIVLRVKGMSDAANYYVVTGQNLDALKSPVETKREGDTLTAEVSKGNFFKVIGARKF